MSSWASALNIYTSSGCQTLTEIPISDDEMRVFIKTKEEMYFLVRIKLAIVKCPDNPESIWRRCLKVPDDVLDKVVYIIMRKSPESLRLLQDILFPAIAKPKVSLNEALEKVTFVYDADHFRDFYSVISFLSQEEQKDNLDLATQVVAFTILQKVFLSDIMGYTGRNFSVREKMWNSIIKYPNLTLKMAIEYFFKGDTRHIFRWQRLRQIQLVDTSWIQNTVTQEIILIASTLL